MTELFEKYNVAKMEEVILDTLENHPKLIAKTNNLLNAVERYLVEVDGLSESEVLIPFCEKNKDATSARKDRPFWDIPYDNAINGLREKGLITAAGVHPIKRRYKTEVEDTTVEDTRTPKELLVMKSTHLQEALDEATKQDEIVASVKKSLSELELKLKEAESASAAAWKRATELAASM